MSTIFQWFQDPGHAALVASLMSALAIILSVLAYRTSRKTQARMLQIEEARERDRLRDRLHARQANLTAKLSREPSGAHYLHLDNDGPAEAREISLTIDGKPFLEHPIVPPQGTSQPTHLGPKSHIRYPMAVTMGNAGPFKIEITWSDESGEPGFYRTTLTV